MDKQMVAGFDVHDIGQIGTIFGIMAILITTFFQIRSYKKDQKLQQEKNRDAITKEINETTCRFYERIEGKLEAIKIAALVTTDDIAELKRNLEALRRYVQELDRDGTIEWKKTKPFIMTKIEELNTKIIELEARLESFRIRKEKIEHEFRDQKATDHDNKYNS